MFNCHRRLVPALIAVLFLFSFVPAAHADPYPDGLNWEYWAKGCVLADGDNFCDSIRGWLEENGGVVAFGLPIGRINIVNRNGNDILEAPYERFRVDFDDTKPDPYAFELGIMGEAALLKQGRVWQNEPKATPNADCDFFAETGHNSCGAFRDYWHSHGLNFDKYDSKYQGSVTYEESLALLGYPITKQEQMAQANGSVLTVQYFQRGRLELHPENAGTPFAIQMGLLNSEVTGETAWALLPGNSPTNQPTPQTPAQPISQPVTQPVSQPTAPPVANPTPPQPPESRTRIGAICRDGTHSSATGSGACSHHGGVDHWLYQ